MSMNLLSDYLRDIFKYEYETGKYGLKQSEFTDDIIEVESSRILKSKRKLKETEICTIVNSNKHKAVKQFKSVDSAIEYAMKMLVDIYIITEESIMTIGDSSKQLVSIK